MKISSAILASLLLITLCVRSVISDSTKNSPQPVQNKQEVQATDEAIAIAFATLHHPELAGLLEQLKSMDHKGYNAAVLDLFRTSERLAKYAERTPERYKTELELWKLDSRIRLLAARSAKGMDDSAREQIRDLLLERNRIRLAQFEAERDKLKARIDKVHDSIEELKSKGSELAEHDLDRLVKTVKSRDSLKIREPVKKSKSTK